VKTGTVDVGVATTMVDWALPPPLPDCSAVMVIPLSTPEVSMVVGILVRLIALPLTVGTPSGFNEEKLNPQAYAAPVEESANEHSFPADICVMVTPLSAPEVSTATGVSRLVM
jgi:hypothetical protein